MTHSSFHPMKTKDSFLTSYENLEYFGDAVHKFFVVKWLKEKTEKNKAMTQEMRSKF